MAQGLEAAAGTPEVITIKVTGDNAEFDIVKPDDFDEAEQEKETE